MIRQQANTDRIYCLNQPAEVAGLRRGMALSNARILCSDLHTALADPHGDARFVRTLARWSSKYCPWVGSDDDGLVLDITGSAHLFGGESALLADIGAGLDRAGFDHADGMADTRGAAWALARFGGGIAQSGATRAAIAPLPVAALRIDETLCGGLRRLGLHTIGQVLDLPRATLARRFGAGLLLRLDQALGAQPEPVSPLVAPVNFSVRMTLPEPIGVASDVMAGLQRLLVRLCATLGAQEKGVRCLQFTTRRVDQGASRIEVRFARPMRDPDRISRLFSERIDKLEAGFGIDQLRLEAVTVEPLPFRQTSRQAVGEGENMADLVTRLGSRVGMENITRYQPANSHIPENSFNVVPAAYSAPAACGWPVSAVRPLTVFPPEPLAVCTPRPPRNFRWRRMRFRTAHADGPERIAPEWWLDNPDWRAGVRDYWKIHTHEGRRLWTFFTPQNPAWFVQGEFA